MLYTHIPKVSCPPGYRISEILAGRFLVSLPVNGEDNTILKNSKIESTHLSPAIYVGTSGAIFGGPSIQEGVRVGNNHSHPFNTWFTTDSCEIGLASGCCGDGYVKDSEYVTEGEWAWEWMKGRRKEMFVMRGGRERD